MFYAFSKSRLVSLLFVLIMGLSSACTSLQTEAQTPVDVVIADPDKTDAAALTVEAESAEDVANRELVQAIDSSSEVLDKDWEEIDVESMAFLRQAFETAIADDDASLAGLIYDDIASRYPDDQSLAALQARVQIANKDYKELRRQSRERFLAGDASAIDAFWQAFDLDPLYGAGFVEDIEPDGQNSLAALGGGSTVSLKYEVGGKTMAAIKPDQELRQTMYRSEIAFFRLCEYLDCSFAVPENVPVRFSRNSFNSLYAASKSSKNSAYRSKFTHLIWETIAGERYLYATYKEWISSFTFFPIEVSSVWRPLLEVNVSRLPDIETFFQRLLLGARPDAPKSVQKFMDYAGNLTTRDLMQQISDLILVDFLTNNWDRFSGDINNFGANCHFFDGGIIAIDNGAAFPAWHAPRVVRRLNLVKTFSKDLVKALRMIDPDALYPRLFPNPTREEIKSLERFTERRQQALKYIDDLIAKHGADAVLIY